MKYIILLFAILCLTLCGCNAVKIKYEEPFKFVTAEYTTTIAGKTEIWSNIEVKLTHLQQGVSFDSIIFKNTRLTITKTNLGDTTLLKATLISRSNKLDVENNATGKPDELIYAFHSKKYRYIIKDFKRHPMRFRKSLH